LGNQPAECAGHRPGAGGIGGWQVPRAGVAEARRRQTNVLTIEDIETLGLEKTAEIALDLGITVRRSADLIIGTFCIEPGLGLLHDDRDFEPMRVHLGLRVI